MADSIKVICDNLGGPIRVAMAPRSPTGRKRARRDATVPRGVREQPHQGAQLQNYTPVTVRFVDITSFMSIRVYQRTSWFILQRPRARSFRDIRSISATRWVRAGSTASLKDSTNSPTNRPRRSKGHARSGGAEPPHRTHQEVLTSELRAIYAEQGLRRQDGAAFDTRPRLYSDLYTLDGTAGYFYGALAPSTGYIDRFCIEPYYKGFYLALPLRTNPGVLNKNVQQEKMFGIFRSTSRGSGSWASPPWATSTPKVLAGDAGGMIKLAEAFHERKFAWVADTIYDATSSARRAAWC